MYFYWQVVGGNKEQSVEHLTPYSWFPPAKKKLHYFNTDLLFPYNRWGFVTKWLMNKLTFVLVEILQKHNDRRGNKGFHFMRTRMKNKPLSVVKEINRIDTETLLYFHALCVQNLFNMF